MDKVKCECGHVNPLGTYLCESCGMPLIDEEKNVVDMRYEGVARRSQTYKKTFVDRIWIFFSSVKVGIWLIIILLLASALGTIFPQEMYLNLPLGESVEAFYEKEYGMFGKIYYTLGFNQLYSSWWYMLLIAALGISLVICSLDRIVPLYRALKNQRVKRHAQFLKRQRIFGLSEKLDDGEEQLKLAEKILRERKYKIRRDGNHLLAEKGRFSRWGPYVNHIGLIIFLIGCMLRYFPAMYFYDHIWIREGEEVVVKGTEGEYFVRNEQFTIELYDEDDELYADAFERTKTSTIKNFETSATLLKRTNEGAIGAGTELEEVKHEFIRVNQPMTFEGFSLYQVDYKLNEFSELTFQLNNVNENEDSNFPIGTFTVNLDDPEKMYDLGNGYYVEIVEYFPNFFINDDWEPGTINRVPDNPRIIFETYTPEMDPDTDEGELSIVGIQVNSGIYKAPIREGSTKEIHRPEGMNAIVTMNLNPTGNEEEYVILGIYVNDEITENNEYTFSVVDFETKNVTALTISRDRTIPILILGGLIFMIGLVQGSYWHHRRIWLQLKDDEIWLAGHANKNWHALKKDIAAVTDNTLIPFPTDQVEVEKEFFIEENIKE